MGGGGGAQRGKLRFAAKLKSTVLLDEQRDGRQDRLGMGRKNMFCKRQLLLSFLLCFAIKLL